MNSLYLKSPAITRPTEKTASTTRQQLWTGHRPRIFVEGPSRLKPKVCKYTEDTEPGPTVFYTSSILALPSLLTPKSFSPHHPIPPQLPISPQPPTSTLALYQQL